jgi:intracellular septation protein
MTRIETNPFVKLALELGPLAVFFAANARFGIFAATGVFMTATLTALALSYALQRRLAIMPLVSGVVVLVFGGLTLWLQDEVFIKLKPTLVNGLFGVVLLAGLRLRKPLLEILFDGMFRLTEEGWRKLTLRWGVFFLVLAALNEIVWRNFSTDTWVTFKAFGLIGLTLVFAFAQAPLIARHEKPEPEGSQPAA